MEEVWKDIVGYEGFYQVSNHGRVKSLLGQFKFNREKLLSLIDDGQGYKCVFLYDQKGNIKKHKVHRLVAEHFIERTQEDIDKNRTHIDHIDGIRSHNTPSNLRWCTKLENSRFENCIKNHRMAARKKKVLCVDLGIVFESSRECARRLGYSGGTISNFCLGRKKSSRHIFRYVGADAKDLAAYTADK